LVFDTSSPQTLRSLQQWVDELREKGPLNIVLALCGNKADLQQDRRVSKEDGCKYAEEIGAFYMEVSAREATNVEELFQDIGRRVIALQGATSTVCTGICVDPFESSAMSTEDSGGCC
jgi:GTPase SAR1 family protein